MKILKNENPKGVEKLKGRCIGIVICVSKETLELTKLHSYGKVKIQLFKCNDKKFSLNKKIRSLD